MRFYKFQSTHPCGVRLAKLEDSDGSSKVSIHAPLRGATSLILSVDATLPGFNPRTPAGCDPGAAGESSLLGRVSIHAPLRGATPGASGIGGECRSFNPRTPAGCDPRGSTSASLSLRFQSTHPCGVRHARVILNGDLLQFQSTHPCGVRL